MKEFNINCVFCENPSPSMIIKQEDNYYKCYECEACGTIKETEKVLLALLRNKLYKDNIYLSKFTDQLIERASENYPVQMVLNNGFIIVIHEMTDIDFYDNHLQIYNKKEKKIKVIYPNNRSEFLHRNLLIPYQSISFVTDA